MIRAQVMNRYSGHYKLEVRRPDGTIRKTLEFDNLVTNNGLNLFCTAPNSAFGIRDQLFHACAVGTGNTPPAVTDTQLANLLVSQAFPRQFGNNALIGTNSFIDGATPYWRRIQTIRFGTGVAAGNLTEIGVGASATNLFSRALITDSGGVPTTLTVLSDEVLDVTFQARNYIDITENPFSFFVNGVEYTGTYKPYIISNIPSLRDGFNTSDSDTYNVTLNAAASTQVLDVYTGQSGSIVTKKFLSADSYVLGSFQRDFTFRFELSEANFGAGGINSFILEGPQSRHRFKFTPAILKTSVKILTLGARFSWGRYP